MTSVAACRTREAVEQVDAFQVLKSSPWFNPLPDEALEALASRAQILHLGRGALFTRKDEPPPGVGIILSGAVCASTVSLQGHEFTLSMMEFNGIIGLTCVLDGKPALRDSRVHIDADILMIPRVHFLDTLDRYPDLYRHFTKILCDRIRTANRIIDELALCSLRQRLARLLWTLAGPREKTPDTSQPHHAIQTQDELANLLGVSRHAVNRELKRMEQAGLLHIDYGRVSILDPASLACVAESG